MGSYTFKWAHAADEVFVTGTFDDWSKSVKLEKVGSVFEKHVDLPNADKKILYKFVVDGTWTTDHTAPQETDEHGNTNNILETSHLEPLGGGAAAAITSTVTPSATTAGLAGEVPKENTKEELPGAFPETPAFETPMSEAAGFSVAPIPATAGIGNPISLAPGEKVPDPSTLTSNTINSTVKTDKESYERSDAAITSGDKEVHASEANGGMFGVPPVSNNMIPESSLPIGPGAQIPSEGDAVTLQSAGPTSTTAALAAQVPLEPRGVPEVVSESQKEAGFAPEASANAEAVVEKKEVEEELKEKVPEAPATSDDTGASEGGVSKEGITGAAVAGVAAAGSAVAGAAVAAKDHLPERLQEPIDQAVGSTTSANTAPEVPAVVAESIAKAHESPEAAANEEAVKEKSAFERELEAKVQPTDQSGEPAPTETAATSAIAPAPTTEPPKDSNEEALNAPASAPATTAVTAAATEAAKTEPPVEPLSEEVSPSTKVVSDPVAAAGAETTTAQAVTNPVPTTTTTAAGPATPKKDTPKQTESATATPDSQSTEKSRKKKHRVSNFFGKLKEKFS